MKRELSFIKDFRPIQGHDGEIVELLECDDLQLHPAKEGVYIIVSHEQKFIYPNGQSKVIYIGMANSLRRRLAEHKTNLENLVNGEYADRWYFDRYQYMKAFGAKVYYYCCQGAQDAKDLESMVLCSFYNRYHAMPVGNGARSFSKANE